MLICSITGDHLSFLPRKDVRRGSAPDFRFCVRRSSGFAPSILLEIFLQGNSVVVLGVVRAVQKSDRILTGGLEDWLPGSGHAIEFSEIPAPELPPLFGVVTEPLSQFGARRSIFEPAIQVVKRSS